jgi:hypothetical protein
VVWEGRSREAPPYPDLWHKVALAFATLCPQPVEADMVADRIRSIDALRVRRRSALSGIVDYFDGSYRPRKLLHGLARSLRKRGVRFFPAHRSPGPRLLQGLALWPRFASPRQHQSRGHRARRGERARFCRPSYRRRSGKEVGRLSLEQTVSAARWQVEAQLDPESRQPLMSGSV